MATITDYLDPATLRELQNSFSAAAKTALVVCDPGGAPVLDDQPPPAEADTIEAPVMVDGSVVACVRGAATGPAGSGGPGKSLLPLLADMLGHRDTRMVHKHYRHPVTPTVSVARDSIEDALGL